MVNTTQKEIFSQNLRAILDQKGMKQKELADIIHNKYNSSVDRTHVNHWYHGKYIPSATNLYYIAEALEVPLGELIGKR